jgi:protein CrcB
VLSYALIGLGGAIGSIGRAWLGTAMLALTGAGFPWGTILINVVGSFVIGFVGTLTAADGRFAAAADLRAFLMVGVCGGFTTFSSFSLQTLDLLRYGRPGPALANILLSVALCLGSVAAGHWLAATIRTGGTG